VEQTRAFSDRDADPQERFVAAVHDLVVLIRVFEEVEVVLLLLFDLLPDFSHAWNRRADDIVEDENPRVVLEVSKSLRQPSSL
jgi:hypothetical protein